MDAQSPKQPRFRLIVEELEPRLALSAAGADFSVQLTPSDPLFGSLYGMTKINAPGAWEQTQGSAKVVVAVNDSGIAYDHPDLYLNIWINQGEIPAGLTHAPLDVDSDGVITFRDLNASSNADIVTNSSTNNSYIDAGDLLRDSRWANNADGDGNGFKDDLIGWDFVNNDNNPYDDNGHGTHVAGTIGASGQAEPATGVGVAGVNWIVSLMAVKISGADGRGTWDNAAKGIRYGVDEGAQVSNNSYGGSFGSSVLKSAIDYAQAGGQLFVAAAGNNGKSNDTWALRSYPASYDNANIISVTATDSADKVAKWANYGTTSVDLAAPGVNVLSTVPGGYAYYSGTSMASPHVAGAAALLLAKNPGLKYDQLKSLLLGNVDKISGLSRYTLTSGRLNVSKAMAAPIPASTLNSTNGGSSSAPSGSGSGLTLADAGDSGAVAAVAENAGLMLQDADAGGTSREWSVVEQPGGLVFSGGQEDKAAVSETEHGSFSQVSFSKSVEALDAVFACPLDEWEREVRAVG